MRAGPLALLLAPLIPVVHGIWPFKQKRFMAEALYNAGTLGLPKDAGRVVAIGDVDGDQNSDLFMLSQDRKTLHVMVWNRDAFMYEERDTVTFEHEITNVTPADFNGDGRMDLLVMWSANSGGGFWGNKGKMSTDMEIIMGNEGGLSKGERWSLPPAGLAQPMLFDDDLDLSPSLLGFAETQDGPKIKAWRNTGHAMRLFTPMLKPIDQVCQLTHPPAGAHSSAFIDMDGDCAPDVVLHCGGAKANNRKLQVWLNRGKEGYILSNTWNLPLGSRSISYADMNRNGAMDLVFPTCKRVLPSTGLGEACKIHVAYNNQAGLCNTKTSQYSPSGRIICRGYDELCSADPYFDFQFWENSPEFPTVAIDKLFPGFKLMINVPGHTDVPLPIRPGDFDVDGFPDLLITISDGKKSLVKVLHNVPCGKDVPGCGNFSAKYSRGFQVLGGKGWEALEAIEDAIGASWIDLDDDGSLDIMVHRTGKQDGETVTFIQNNFYHDAFFLKGQVLNGACDRRRCFPVDGGKPYSALGCSISGATFKFTSFDTRGNRHAQNVAQLPQTCYHSLLSPHTFMGLGRTNNYIENLKVGTSLKSDENRVTSLDGVIPNSQVILNPPWSRALRTNETVLYRSKEWRTELFLHPGDWIPWVAAAVVGTVVTLGMVVVWLGEREKREDEKERRRALHAINFQAL
ncbi:uncharacterized protein CcaverHIS019_0105300 [Cutaneotrichosporon cavernicola]|uniref:T-cell immunomodulatory protein TIP C2 domain-containing protein n=1 Tax=Cutaneotrichosporon cavernicola TaxID=279322 RepID=A0AA48I7W3_9TREE|nr:uncharacterized protein CcaverHIS019_0105300 [Cutaneotrichosporon cavernicola]BEI87812.1 hypothetical protein CcaverHIS019_0105300 [Cutaneotrichosporon cavernicola]BEI95586.1 hypothetical protein CcaverHIS631_0105350 [Cutaneotrichosporon cavernicola]BEJ03360.1 hypothetical protein CcaverHIS641_0105350 [Cutaneotrichosporon cavernicola]